jgi:plasmid stabilization system protein ParE
MEATAWYLETAGVDIGLRFTEEFDRTLDRIAMAPFAWTEIKPGMRRALLHGFPYAVLYAIDAERVEVLRVMHQRRHPSQWQRR